MGRIINGSTLPVRNLPSPVTGKEREKEPPPHYLEWTNTQILRAMRLVSRYNADLARTVEEYAGESTTIATGETQLRIIPDYEPGPECITAVLVTGPASTAFTLQLGGRNMPLLTDASGKLLLSPVFFRLKPDDPRLLTSATSGSWFFQMSGYALLANETG